MILEQSYRRGFRTIGNLAFTHIALTSQCYHALDRSQHVVTLLFDEYQFVSL